MAFYKCTHIHYHANWTKFFFDAVSSAKCLAISIVRKEDENASRKWKEGEVYDFDI